MPRYATKVHKTLYQQILKSGVKSRKISIFKEFLRNDKSTIHLPRQETNFLLKVLYLQGFERYSIGF